MVVGNGRQAAFGRPRGAGAQQKKAVGRGTAKMRAAADKALEDNSEKIANSLVTSIESGNVSSAKLLCSLAEGHIAEEDAGTAQPTYSLAKQLAVEKQWEERPVEGCAEAGQKQSEPLNKGAVK
jgi:hypothetical protein